MSATDAAMLPDVPEAGAASWAKPQDWEKHRELITRMYREMSLATVMESMKTEHNFKATLVNQVTMST